MTSIDNRIRGMMWGAMVADAATMGLHWLYDQDRIRAVAPAEPAFHGPEASDFDGVPSYYAHAQRCSGMLSQYGEQALVMARTVAQDAPYNQTRYQELFRAQFGYGGSYVGYIDRPTRFTLNMLTQREDEAATAARALDPTVEDSVHQAIFTLVTDLRAKHSGDALAQEIAQAVRAVHGAEREAYALKLADLLADVWQPTGADDVQLPAISKLPALVARHHADADLMQRVEDAVRVTNHADSAVAYGRFAADLLRHALRTGEMPDLAGLTAQAAPEVRETVGPVLLQTHRSTEDVTAEIGLSCYLRFGVPSVVHNLATAPGYCEAVRRNIYAGGDNCGRSILLGAVMGAIHGIATPTGIPMAWCQRLTQRADLPAL